MRTAILVACLVACDASEREPTDGIVKPPPSPSCREVVCTHVPECAPVQTGGVDLTSQAACLDGSAQWRAMPECYDAAACLAALDALPCLPESPTWDDIDATARAMAVVRDACIGPPPYVESQ